VRERRERWGSRRAAIKDGRNKFFFGGKREKRRKGQHPYHSKMSKASMPKDRKKNTRKIKRREGKQQAGKYAVNGPVGRQPRQRSVRARGEIRNRKKGGAVDLGVEGQLWGGLACLRLKGLAMTGVWESPAPVEGLSHENMFCVSRRRKEGAPREKVQ